MTAIAVRIRVGLVLARNHEESPISRTRFGSPCRFVRTIDLVVHVLLPEILCGVAPKVADYLRSTSPRWGRTWRNW